MTVVVVVVVVVVTVRTCVVLLSMVDGRGWENEVLGWVLKVSFNDLLVY